MKVIKPTQRVRIKVATSGKAPNKYGNRVYKIGKGESRLLQARGWTIEKKGREYVYMRLPEREQGKPPFIIETAIPTQEEVMQMAEEARREGADCVGLVGEWPLRYETPKTMTITTMDPFTGTQIGEPSISKTAPVFYVGGGLLGRVV